MNESFQGEVFSVNPKVDEKRISANSNPQLKERHALWPGMNVEVEIRIPKGERLQVPKEFSFAALASLWFLHWKKNLAKWN